jgi:glycosyltransferase involved in cell wall biosynthesis
MPKLVSVVIPTYNYAKFVGRAIDSALAQTYSSVEVVVVDDGSSDDTPEVLARYGDRIRAIRQDNKGLSGARNTGLKAARGDYVALLDADDYWRPDKLEKQVALAERVPNVGAVGCVGEAVDRTGATLGFIRFDYPVSAPPDRTSEFRGVAAREHWVGCSASGALIPKRVLDDVGGFDETLRAAEDWDMWLRIASKYTIRNTPELLCSICQHGTGTFRNPEKMETNQWKVYENAVARWPDLLDARTRRKMRALILADAGGEYVTGKNYAMALRRYFASVRAWPMHGGRWYKVARLLAKRAGI